MINRKRLLKLRLLTAVLAGLFATGCLSPVTYAAEAPKTATYTAPPAPEAPPAEETVSEDRTEDKEKENSEDKPAPNPEMAKGVAETLMDTFSIDKTSADAIANMIVEGHPEATSVQISNAIVSETQIVVDFKYDGNESSIVYDFPTVLEDDTTTYGSSVVQQSPNDIGFFVGGEVINTDRGPLTVQLSSLPVGYQESAGMAEINSSTTQYRAWALPDGSYRNMVALITGSDISMASREPIVTALLSSIDQYAAGSSDSASDNSSSAGGDSTGLVEVINEIFPTSEADSGFLLSDANGTTYTVTRYTTYLDLSPIDSTIGRITASDAYLAPYGSGYAGYLMECIKDETDADGASMDPVTMISSLLDDPSYLGKSHDEIIKDLKGKLKDSQKSALTKDAEALKDKDTTATAGSFLKILLLGEAKYQMADVGNVTDADLYVHTVGEGGGLTMPASYADEEAISDNFVEYEIEDSSTYTPADSSTDFLKKIGVTYIVLIIISAFISLITIAGMWRVFAKAGEGGWKVLIPILNAYTLVKIATGGFLWFILMFVPFVDIAAAIIVPIKLAKSFDKSTGFGIGLLLLPFIFYPKLGFSEDEYIGPYGDVPGRSEVFGDGDKPKKSLFKKREEEEMEELDNLDDDDDEFD
ncbi:MAG: DUF5684 domain-containing protein [Lachnospiraceae bacterium]|nr:DUF5684 domain-containing protein [Lachnospiraceae bacterium]